MVDGGGGNGNNDIKSNSNKEFEGEKKLKIIKEKKWFTRNDDKNISLQTALIKSFIMCNICKFMNWTEDAKEKKINEKQMSRCGEKKRPTTTTTKKTTHEHHTLIIIIK